MEYPRLRPLEIFPVEHQGKRLLCLRDPHGHLEAPLFLPIDLISVLQHLDGTNSLRDIQAAYFRQYGQLLYTEQIEALVQELDQALLLESDHFRSVVAERQAAFKRLTVRPTSLAGRAYPKEPAALGRQLTKLFTAPGGPGSLPADGGQPDGRLAAIVAPHIDFARGGPCYAHAYKALQESCGASCFVILGTCHRPTSQPFIVTRKAFQTPLGVVPTDGGFIDSLQARVDGDLSAEEIAHRDEHTIECQVVFLQYLRAGRQPFRIVPILVSSFHEAIVSGTSPMAMEPIGQFIEALRETLDEEPGVVCLVASADLAHVGPQFGDPAPLGQSDWDRVRQEDLALMEHAVAADAEEFFQEMVAQGDRNRICGFPPIYTLLAALEEGVEGDLLNYGQWPGPYGTVTYASLTYVRPKVTG
ncbi:MAG: AmmeMemoRadiSam system protein B [Candidatus Tectimicrobiota bacterium]